MRALRERLRVEDEGGDALRKLAGLLLALGLLLVFIRRSSFEDPWGDLPLLLILLVTFLFLYGSALIAGPPDVAVAAPAEGPPAPAGAPPAPPAPPPAEEAGSGSWKALYAVFGVIVLPLVLFQFLEWIDGDTAAPLNIAWIFLVTAVAAVAAALLTRTRYTLLLAGLSLIVAWLGLWEEILSDGLAADLGTLRGLLVLIAVILLAGAAVVYLLEPGRLGIRRGSELVTAAGVAAIAAGGLSITTFAAIQGDVDVGTTLIASPSFLWDLFLLVASLLLILYGARFAARGPVYAGGVGLLIFLIIVGLELADLADAIGGADLGAVPEGSIVGWPLALLLVGAAVFVLSLLPGVRRGGLGIDRLERGDVRRPGPPSAGPSVPGAPPPAAPPPGP